MSTSFALRTAITLWLNAISDLQEIETRCSCLGYTLVIFLYSCCVQLQAVLWSTSSLQRYVLPAYSLLVLWHCESCTSCTLPQATGYRCCNLLIIVSDPVSWCTHRHIPSADAVPILWRRSVCAALALSWSAGACKPLVSSATHQRRGDASDGGAHATVFSLRQRRCCRTVPQAAGVLQGMFGSATCKPETK